MKSLLKVDLSRIFKDKMLIIVGILSVVFAAITPLLYAAILAGTDTAQDPMVTEMLSGYFSGKAQFFASFSIGNNMGLIAPVFIAIILCKDFSYGTIRNKIISGKRRGAIYMSLFISCSVTFISVMMLQAFVTLGISLIFFDYQPNAFTLADFWYFLESLGFVILILLCVSAILSWLCATKKNTGLVIVLYIAFAFGLALAGSLIQMLLTVLEPMGAVDEGVINLLRFADRINIANSSAYIGTSTEYTTKDVLYLTVPATVGIVGFTTLGLIKFRKKDIK